MTSTDSLSADKRRGPRWPATLLAVPAIAVVVGAATLVGCGSQAPKMVSPTSAAVVSTTSTALLSTTSLSEPPTSGSPTTTSTTIYVNPIPRPARIVIPAIRVDAKIIRVGRLDDGKMEVPPFGLAGWYTLGPAPGASGPSVIVAHVDSKEGPDVFFRLKDLRPGDEILIYDEDGHEATFLMDIKEQQLKSELPTERIWNDTWQPVIRLITCGGDFDRSSGHYLSNVIVYGHLTE